MKEKEAEEEEGQELEEEFRPKRVLPLRLVCPEGVLAGKALTPERFQRDVTSSWDVSRSSVILHPQREKEEEKELTKRDVIRAFVEAAMIRFSFLLRELPSLPPPSPPPGLLDIRLRSECLRREVSDDDV